MPGGSLGKIQVGGVAQPRPQGTWEKPPGDEVGCGMLLETLTLFQTKINDFCTLSDLNNIKIVASAKKHTQFQTPLAEIYTQFQTKRSQKLGVLIVSLRGVNFGF